MRCATRASDYGSTYRRSAPGRSATTLPVWPLLSFDADRVSPRERPPDRCGPLRELHFASRRRRQAARSLAARSISAVVAGRPIRQVIGQFNPLRVVQFRLLEQALGQGQRLPRTNGSVEQVQRLRRDRGRVAAARDHALLGEIEHLQRCGRQSPQQGQIDAAVTAAASGLVRPLRPPGRCLSISMTFRFCAGDRADASDPAGRPRPAWRRESPRRRAGAELCRQTSRLAGSAASVRRRACSNSSWYARVSTIDRTSLLIDQPSRRNRVAR